MASSFDRRDARQIRIKVDVRPGYGETVVLY